MHHPVGLASGGMRVYQVWRGSFLGVVIRVDVQLFHLHGITVLSEFLGDLDASVVGCQADQEDDLWDSQMHMWS